MPNNNDDLYHEPSLQAPVTRRQTAEHSTWSRDLPLTAVVSLPDDALNGYVAKVAPHAYTWVEGTPPREPAPPIAKLPPRDLAYAASSVNRKVINAEAKLNDLRRLLQKTGEQVMDLDISVALMTNSLHAPGRELADAKGQIEELEKQVRGLIREAQRQKKRADRAEERAAITQPEIEKSAPGEVAFLRCTPGDAVRYFAQEVMKHAEADGNAHLMGASMGLRMVADDVDRLLQG